MTAFLNILLTFLGGGLGASLRYGITLVPYRPESLWGFPLLTFVINFLGSFAIGVVSALAEAAHWDSKWVTFIKVGILGGFTTFSSFALDGITLFEGNKAWIGIAYVVLTVVNCLFGCYLGRLLVKAIVKSSL